mmetsp:Transcript_31773/g.61208  ORF Transcript_31773/g.61208 Transcript_31773/m.61208 type:complete len:598 (+) Transcript_31773:281-2074(+)
MNSSGLLGDDDANELLDEHGKARFGTPGPGEYTRVGAFGETVVYDTAASYTFGTKPTGPRQQPFISRAHSKATGGGDSPGPMYQPSTAMTSKAAARAAFSTADRGAERARFISKMHCDENKGATTPGPGTYRLKHGKGVAKTLGDAPAFKFPEAPRDHVVTRAALYNPGPGAHQLPQTLGTREDGRNPEVTWAPKYSFAPARVDGHSLTRDTGLGASKVPGPGTYDLKTSFGTGERDTHIDSAMNSTRNPAFSFGRGGRSLNRQPFISKQHVEPDPASPGPIYMVTKKLADSAAGAKFGYGTRFYSPEEGPSHAGPFISQLHSQTSGPGSASPGPAYYKPKPASDSEAANGSKFSTTIRLKLGKGSNAHDWVPGPGAYQLPKNAPELTGRQSSKSFQAGASYSVASCLRTDFTALSGVGDNPAPNEYEVDVGIARKDVRKPKAPGTKFGKCTNRSSFRTDIGPGPGQYSPERRDMGSSFSFGTSRSEDLGKMMNEKTKKKKGDGTPGPASYNLKTGKGFAKTMGDAAMTKFGTATRGNTKMYLGPDHVKVDAAEAGGGPGPGAYKPDGISGFSNRYKNNGGCSFGTSKRPPMATVKF